MDVELPPLPFLPPSQREKNEMIRWATAAVLAERERIAAETGKLIEGWDGPYRRAGDLVLLAIRQDDATPTHPPAAAGKA